MRRLTALMAVLIGGIFASNALAVQPGKSLEWDTPMGKVVMEGKKHADAGLKCMDCHKKIFKMKKGSTVMKMADINKGKFCGECHNGSRAFAASDKKNCEKCHNKSKP